MLRKDFFNWTYWRQAAGSRIVTKWCSGLHTSSVKGTKQCIKVDGSTGWNGKRIEKLSIWFKDLKGNKEFRWGFSHRYTSQRDINLFSSWKYSRGQKLQLCRIGYKLFLLCRKKVIYILKYSVNWIWFICPTFSYWVYFLLMHWN